MFRRKEESFEFESEGNNSTGSTGTEESSATSGSVGAGEYGQTDATEARSSAPAPSAAASAPRTAALPQAPGAAPRAPAPAAAPSSFRAATPPSASAQPAPRAPTPAASPSAPSTASASSSASSSSSAKTGGKRILTVGNDILLKGEIATCDRLVIEGEVDAKLNDVHTVEIAETGSFTGKAQIEDAEISGVFEGELVVRNRLTIYSTGKVRGKIAYGEIEIERGGELTGEITIVGQVAKSKEKAA